MGYRLKRRAYRFERLRTAHLVLEDPIDDGAGDATLAFFLLLMKVTAGDERNGPRPFTEGFIDSAATYRKGV